MEFNDQFFELLFATIPVSALVVDERQRVHAVNDAARNFIGDASADFTLRQNGQVLKCIHNSEHAEGCGNAPVCQTCTLRNAALQAFKGNSIHRLKGRFEIWRHGKVKAINILVSSAPLIYRNEKLAVLILEEISSLTELKGHIPICASCMQIRDDDGDWVKVEHYIEQRSEAEFTHDLCPECIKELYPRHAEKVLRAIGGK